MYVYVCVYVCVCVGVCVCVYFVRGDRSFAEREMGGGARYLTKMPRKYRLPTTMCVCVPPPAPRSPPAPPPCHSFAQRQRGRLGGGRARYLTKMPQKYMLPTMCMCAFPLSLPLVLLLLFFFPPAPPLRPPLPQEGRSWERDRRPRARAVRNHASDRDNSYS